VIAQVVERGPEKAGVGGAAPPRGTIFRKGFIRELIFKKEE